MYSELTAIVIVRGQGTHGGVTAVADGRVVSGGVAAHAMGRGKGDVMASGGGRGGSNGGRGGSA